MAALVQAEQAHNARGCHKILRNTLFGSVIKKEASSCKQQIFADALLRGAAGALLKIDDDNFGEGACGLATGVGGSSNALMAHVPNALVYAKRHQDN